MYAAVGAQRLVHVMGLVRVTTESSLWLLRPNAGGQYLRMPLAETSRPEHQTPDGALDDLRWLRYREARLVRSPVGDRLRIVPADRPEGSKGVITGVILSAVPPIEELLVPEDDSPQSGDTSVTDAHADVRSVRGDRPVEGHAVHVDRQHLSDSVGNAEGG